MLRTVLSYFIAGVGAYFLIFKSANIYGIIIFALGIFGIIGDFIKRRGKKDDR